MRTRHKKQGQKAKTIAFVHHKGGTGKTTSCLNIAGWLANMYRKVLVVDLDPQGNATTGLGINRESLQNSIYEVIFGHEYIEETILETESGVHLVPSSLDLLSAEIRMAGQINNTGILRNHLGNVAAYYDYILIDVPPGSTMLMINGIVASDSLIIPLDSGIFALEALETLSSLFMDIEEELGVKIKIMMILLRKYPIPIIGRRLTKDVQTMVESYLTINDILIPKTITIPYSKRAHSAQIRGMPISHLAPFSRLGRGYKKIAEEIIYDE